ncbi:MAG: UDP-3-O-acyl-N-acetylglucosamine deacetylase [Rhodospirillales bacterium]|jgi:UDP-3-O-[3-hydroxymyristoyl] N-acetylglucosamine deacetylase|nr:UDP-3-O-acyl-N-acetylglucosamine deacetylase [Rhodospirillales bacterium]
MDGLSPFPTLLAASRRTLKAPIGCVGVGLHSGARVALRLVPAAAGSGIVFRRTDLGIDIPARFDHVADTRLCTVLSQHADGSGARIATVEHVMAALAGAGVHDAIVEVDGPETPVLDGSAANFLFLIDCAGSTAAEGPAAPFAIEVLRAVRVSDGEGFAELTPNRDAAFDMALSIDFAAPAIGRQALSLRFSPANFRTELAQARTFTLLSEIEALRRAGLALGGSLDNAVVVDGEQVLNPSGLRAPDEFVRHKLLDAVGDLALAGAPLRGRFRGHRSGHALNNRLLRALFADAANWRTAAADEAQGAGFAPFGAWSQARLPLAAAPV